jgi:hypothetical protein
LPGTWRFVAERGELGQEQQRGRVDPVQVVDDQQRTLLALRQQRRSASR